MKTAEKIGRGCHFPSAVTSTPEWTWGWLLSLKGTSSSFKHCSALTPDCSLFIECNLMLERELSCWLQQAGSTGGRHFIHQLPLLSFFMPGLVVTSVSIAGGWEFYSVVLIKAHSATCVFSSAFFSLKTLLSFLLFLSVFSPALLHIPS